MAHLRQNNTHRTPGFIAQGPKPIPGLDSFRASVRKPPQPAVKLTHRYQLSQQAPKVLIRILPPTVLCGPLQASRIPISTLGSIHADAALSSRSWGLPSALPLWPVVSQGRVLAIAESLHRTLNGLPLGLCHS